MVGIIKTTGTTFAPAFAINIIFETRAVIKIERNIKYMGVNNKPNLFFLIAKKPVIKAAGRNNPKSSP